jgi:hypothetical protein
MRRRRNKRIRQRATDARRREAIAPYLAELRRNSRVPPSVVKQAKPMLLLLLGSAVERAER